jgi:hypothetical protein
MSNKDKKQLLRDYRNDKKNKIIKKRSDYNKKNLFLSDENRYINELPSGDFDKNNLLDKNTIKSNELVNNDLLKNDLSNNKLSDLDTKKDNILEDLEDLEEYEEYTSDYFEPCPYIKPTNHN